MASQILNVFLTMVGAGIVALPYALASATYNVGTITLIVSLFFSLAATVTLTWLTRRKVGRHGAGKKASGLAGDDEEKLLATKAQGDNDTVVQVESQLLHDLLPPEEQDEEEVEVISTYDELVERMLPWWGASLGQIVMVSQMEECDRGVRAAS